MIGVGCTRMVPVISKEMARTDVGSNAVALKLFTNPARLRNPDFNQVDENSWLKALHPTKSKVHKNSRIGRLVPIVFRTQLLITIAITDPKIFFFC